MGLFSGIPWTALARLGPQFTAMLRLIRDSAGGQPDGMLMRVGVLEQEMAVVMKTLTVLTVSVVILFLLSVAFLITGILLLLRSAPAA